MTTIINFMPLHEAAPVALHLLKADLDAAATAVSAVAARYAAGEVFVLVPQGDPVAAGLAASLGDSARVVEADPSLGFVYANDTACACVLAGEKPLPAAPNGTTEGLELIQGSELLAAPGTRAVWFAGADAPRELPASVTVGEIVQASGVVDAKAVYLGFPCGTFLSAADADVTVDLATDYVRVYGAGNCMAKALADVCADARKQTCGRCVFGHEGGHQIAATTADICRKKGRASDIALLRDLCPVMARQSLCEQGRVLADSVLSALDAFGPEIEGHFTRKVCAAGECPAYMTFHILPDKCVGCGECIDACEEDAILGKSRFVHVIDQKACVQCGACVDACAEGAIVKAGADKPRTPPRPIPIRRR